MRRYTEDMLLVKMKMFIFMLTFMQCSLCFRNSDSFNEKLFIKPLSTGHIYTNFQFVVQKEIHHNNEKDFLHFHLFPRPLGEILSHHSLQELHFSLTQGLWRHEKWGYPIRSAPPGAELWALFKGNGSDITSNWQKLTHVLSGQFCASLNFIEGSNTVIPLLSFRPEGALPSSYNSSFVRYSTLPPEIVCTENLTPFRKLLPCAFQAGLSTLLNALNIFSAHYMSLAVDVQTVCKNNCRQLAVELVQSVSIVFDAPGAQVQNQDWSFVKLFGSSLTSACPMASQSQVWVDISFNKSGKAFSLTSKSYETVHEPSGATYALYDLKKIFAQVRTVNIGAIYKQKLTYDIIKPPPLVIDRKISGYGQERGGIRCTFYHQGREPLKIIYLDVVPWYLRLYSHTLQFRHGDNIISPEFVHYIPARDRVRPHHLEVSLTLPPSSVTEMSVQFDLAFLKWTEYPPDANHGFYVGSAVISTRLNGTVSPHKKNFHRIYTQMLLVSLPTPDFSMPYNVICLTCTVIALAFGPIHNITTKRLHSSEENKDDSFTSKVKKFFKKWWNSGEKQKEKSEEQIKKEQ